MKFVGITTFKTPEGDVVLTSTKEIGADAGKDRQQHALHMLVGGMVNDLQIQPGVFKALTVTVED